MLGCLWAPSALGQAIKPDFTWSPPSPIACEQVTFTPSDIPTSETVTWDYENDSTFVATNTHTFLTEGSHPVTMSVTNDNNPVTHSVVVQNAPPVASFNYSPANPDPGEPVLFVSSSTDCGDSITVAWDFDADGQPDSTALSPTHQFDTPGPHSVTLSVTDGDATDVETKTVDVRDPSVPIAAFHRDPGDSVLQTGQVVTFTSDSTALPGSTLSWEIDGVSAGGAASVTHAFANPGNHVVRLTVVQPNGSSAVAESTFRVNAPPVAGLVWTPASPVEGNAVQLYSTSVDAEGALASQAWELDGDGDFNDAFGSSATYSFTAGDHDVSLRVTDSDGVTRTITRKISVAAAPATSAPPRLMNPFPTVRLAGLIVPRGARIKLVEVRGAPRGARVTVRCTGKGCPFRLRRRVAETGRVRLSSFARVLQAGTRLQVYVRAPRVIGKYAAFRIRAGKRPLRVDRCLMPGAAKPTPCT